MVDDGDSVTTRGKLRHHRRTIVAALAAGLVCGVLATGNASASRGDGGFSQCQPIKGPTWIFPNDSFNRSDLFQTSISSNLYESFVVNFGCSQATRYIKQLIGQTLAVTTPGVFTKLTAGPGFSCIAYPDKNGHAYAGSCVSGSSKFDWNYNVMWHGVPGTSSGEGGLGVEPMGSIEYSTTIRPLGGDRYQLSVENTSAIGAINDFSWSAPQGLTITAITKTTNASCSLDSGTISCDGKLKPPQCLCTGSGGVAVIEFTATGDAPTVAADGHPVIHGFGWSYLRISKMTPVPYLVPDAVPSNPKANL
jgi:hypothetical protein